VPISYIMSFLLIGVGVDLSGTPLRLAGHDGPHDEACAHTMSKDEP